MMGLDAAGTANPLVILVIVLTAIVAKSATLEVLARVMTIRRRMKRRVKKEKKPCVCKGICIFSMLLLLFLGLF